MALARDVQEAALPAGPPRAHGLDVAVRFHAAAEVGGDFYDFYQQDRVVGLLVGDAAGKGVPAALVATTAMHLFHSQAPQFGLAGWCDAFNRELGERTPSTMLVTAFCCRLDPISGEGGWVSAGHPPPVLYRRGNAPVLLEGHDMMFGVSEDTTYSERPLRLGPGDVLVIYTDGLTEAVRHDGSLIREEPIFVSLPSLAAREAEGIAAGIEAYLLENATLRDDLTLVVVKKEAAESGEIG
jgi:sigma-B regulation protein RsbU (phosphoserine phosphatase)